MIDAPTAELIYKYAASAIKDIGFPIFVALWLLLRVEPALRELTKAITDLREVNQVAAGLTRRWRDPKPQAER